MNSSSSEASKLFNQVAVLNILTIFAAVAFYLYSGIYLYLTLLELSIFNFFAGIGFIGINVVLRMGKDYNLVSHTCIAYTYTCLLIINFVLGATDSPTLVWILMANIGAAYLLNFKANIFWLIATLIHPLLLFFLEQSFLSKYMYDLDPASYKFLYLSSIFIFFLLGSFFLITYQRSYIKLLNNFEKSIEKSKGMLRIIEHDIANPLTVMLSSCNILKINYPEDSVVQRINGSTLKIIKILNAVRELDLVESGQKELDMHKVDIIKCTRTSLDLLQDKMQRKGIQVEWNLPLDQKFFVKANEDLLTYQVITNILSNAIKFSDTGGKISIGVNLKDQYLNFWIRDYGMGIPIDILENIFDPYTKTNRKGTRGEAGSGFGLPIVKSSMEMMGGAIKVESSDKDGQSYTKMSLYLKEA